MIVKSVRYILYSSAMVLFVLLLEVFWIQACQLKTTILRLGITFCKYLLRIILLIFTCPQPACPLGTILKVTCWLYLISHYQKYSTPLPTRQPTSRLAWNMGESFSTLQPATWAMLMILVAPIVTQPLLYPHWYHPRPLRQWTD